MVSLLLWVCKREEKGAGFPIPQGPTREPPQDTASWGDSTPLSSMKQTRPLIPSQIQTVATETPEC